MKTMKEDILHFYSLTEINRPKDLQTVSTDMRPLT